MALNAFSLALIVAIKLALSEVALVPPRHDLFVVRVLRWLIGAMVWFALGVGIIVTSINRVMQVRERTREFAIIRMLGGSFSFIAILLAEETILIALLGEAIGIAVAALVGSLMSSWMPELFRYETRVDAWLGAGCLAAVGFFCLSAVTAWVTTKQHDVLAALSYK